MNKKQLFALFLTIAFIGTSLASEKNQSNFEGIKYLCSYYLDNKDLLNHCSKNPGIECATLDFHADRAKKFKSIKKIGAELDEQYHDLILYSDNKSIPLFTQNKNILENEIKQTNQLLKKEFPSIKESADNNLQNITYFSTLNSDAQAQLEIAIEKLIPFAIAVHHINKTFRKIRVLFYYI